MRRRIHYLDIIRCFACILVVLMHAPYPAGGVSGIIVVPISLFTAPCIGLFFMVSGALLLPSKDNVFEFMGKRLSKVLVPILVWTFVGIILNGLYHGWGRQAEIIHTICSIPFSTQGHGVLWFMYALVGLYLLVPILSPWLEKCSQKELRLYILLWMLTMSFPYLKMFVTVNDSHTGIFYYITGYVGYFILGYYLKKYSTWRSIWALLWLPVPFLLLGISKKYNLPLNLHSHFWYLCLPTAISAWSWFTIIKNLESMISTLNPKILKFITHFSNCSFGIYLMHIYLMRYGLWTFFNIYHVKGFLSLLISFLGTITLSYILTWGISLLPIGNFIIGFKKIVKNK